MQAAVLQTYNFEVAAASTFLGAGNFGNMNPVEL